MAEKKELIKIGNFYNEKGEIITPNFSKLSELFFIKYSSMGGEILPYTVELGGEGDILIDESEYNDLLSFYSKLKEGEFITFNTSGLFGYKDTETVVTLEDLDSRNLRIVLKGYSTSEKLSLIVKNLDSVKGTIIGNLENRGELNPAKPTRL
jgi:hypothetical protein